MSTKIVTKLINSYPPRRFLEKSESGIWQEVPLKRAVTKTSQALRDVARDRANKAAGVKKATATPPVVKSSLRQAKTVSNASIPLASVDAVPINNNSSAAHHEEPQQNADWSSAPPQQLQEGENFETSVDLFLDDLNAGLLDDILESGVDGVLDNASDDNLSFDLLGSNEFDDSGRSGSGAGMKKEVALLDWINSSKLQLEGIRDGGITAYLQFALGVAVKLTEFIIKSNDGGEVGSIPLDCISIENVVVSSEDVLSMALGVLPDENNTIVEIKFPSLLNNSVLGSTEERLFALGRIFLPLLSGSGSLENNSKVDGLKGETAPTMASLTLDRCGEEYSTKKRQQVEPFFRTQLEQLDLPPPVTTILLNLLECGQGEFITNEAYVNFEDLFEDLMLLKTEGLSRFDQFPNIEMGDNICGREEEIELLNSSFMNKSGNHGIMITGAAGVGKSRVASHIFELTKKEGGLVFATKFDQSQDVSPLMKIGAIFNDLIDLFADVASPSTLSNVSNDLENVLGIHAALLYEVLPSLSRIMPSCSQVSYYVDHVNVANSMKYLLFKLFEALMSYLTGRVTLLFDDLQWADDTSLSLISSLLLHNEGSNRVYFTCCYRDIDMNDSFASWLQSISGFSLDHIRLESLTPNGVNRVVSETLHLFPRLTRQLSLALHKKTGGNPLFLRQILSSIAAATGVPSHKSSSPGLGDAISFSLNKQRWTWDIDMINDLELADDVISFIVKGMEKLSADLLFGLKIAACIGSRMSSDVVGILAAELTADLTGTTLEEVLHKLTEKSFLNEHECSPNRKKTCCFTPGSSVQFEFAHDKVQEAAYKLMSHQEQRLNHMRFGLALYPRVIDKSNEDLLFLAINQINVAGPDSVVDTNQKLIIANLNLNAGNRAGRRSDFRSAFSLFQIGISFLGADCWENNYGTAIELFDAAAQAAVVVNDLDAVTLYSSVINARARSFDDKLNCIQVKLKALIHMERFEEAMNYFSEILKDFEEPPLQTIDEIYGDMMAMVSMMKGLADDSILSFPSMKQKKSIALVKIFCDISQVLVFSAPQFLSALTLRNMQLTVKEGLCSKAPLVLAQYAQSLSAMGNSENISESVRFGRLSKKLVERFGSSDEYTLYVPKYYVMGLAQPFQAMTEEFKLCTKAAEQSGDIYYAVGSSCLVLVMSYITGKPLDEIRRGSIDCIVQMKDRNMMAYLGLQALLHSQIAALMEGTQIADCESVDDVIFGEKKALAAAVGDNFEALSCYEINHLVRAFLFRNFETLPSSWFFKTLHDRKMLNEPYRYFALFFAGLASFHFARERTDEVEKWMTIGNSILDKMEVWNNHILWNFENKMLLLQAEKEFCVGHTASAEALYEKSIKAAHDHKFIHEEAISHELFGHFLLNKGNLTEALRSFNSSIECYMSWGALAVAKRLEIYVQSKFCT